MERSHLPLYALGFMTVVTTAAVVAMLLMVDPDFADSWTFTIFYLSLFAALTGLVTWLFLLLQGRFGRVKRPLGYFFTEAVRQGALIAGLATASLFLQARGRLTVFSAVLLVVFVFLLEAWAAPRRRIL